MIWFENDHVEVALTSGKPYRAVLMFTVDREEILDKNASVVVRCDCDIQLHLAYLSQLKRVIE